MLIFYWLLIAQIVLESFPISSSTHVKLIENILERCTAIKLSMHYTILPYAESTLMNTMLTHCAHGPTVAIVALFFIKRWMWLLINWKRCWRIIIKIICFTAIADIGTVLFFVFLHKRVYPWYMTGIGLLITLVCLYSLRYCPSGYRSWNGTYAIILGVVQGVALLPGISRFASTYVAARWLGIVPHKAFECSLLIQWPLITVAFLNSVRILGCGNLQQILNLKILLIIIVASIIAWYGLQYVAYMSKTNRWWWFSLYMLIPLSIWLYLVLY